MTSNSSSFDKLFEVLRSAQTILKCPICLEKMINPSQLTPCGHIFCQRCIKKVYTIPKNQPCSICNKLFSRRNIVSVNEQMAEYKDMLASLIAQLSLDLGYNIASHIADKSSTNKGFSSIREKGTIKNNIDNVNREDSKVNQQDANKNNISESKEVLKMNKQNTSKSNLKISNINEDNLKINDHLEFNLKPERKSSRRKSSVEVVKSTNSPNLDISFSKVSTQPSTSTVRTMTFNSESSGDESLTINQLSEEDLDIFVRKSIRREIRPRTKTIPIQNKMKSTSKKKISKLKIHQNKDISHEEDLQGTVDKMKVDPSSNEIISATKSAMMKSTSFSESDLEDISDNGADLNTSLKKGLNCRPTNLQARNSKSESLINKTEEQNNKIGDKQKRKRLGKCLALNTNIEINLESPLVKSPVRKRHCSDIGIQTSPSRLISLFNDTKTMSVIKETAQKQFINQPSITRFKSPFEKCMTNASPFNIVSSIYKTPVVSNIHHSTPILAMINKNSINDDISMQITQRNPKFNSDKECEQNNLEENRHDLTVGNMKTPMMNKIFLPGNCSNQKFSVISNPTTSERRRINDSKFLNNSIGIPGDSLLENSDLSSSILQNTVKSVILTKHTPSTVHEKSKRVSRKLLDVFEDESDLFDTNNEEEVLDKSNSSRLLIVESERSIECPVTLDTNEHGKEIVQTDIQKLDIGSESSSKENKNPKISQDLFIDDIRSLESSSRNENTFLKEKNVLKNIVSQKVVPSGSGILIVNNTPLSSEATVMSSQCDLIKNAAEVIGDSGEEEEQCLIEASPEKLSQPMTQSITSGIYKTCEPKDFCFVTSSLLPSQLRLVKILAEVLGCRITGNITHDTTHLIIQTCEKGRVKRTLKYLQAIVLHKIVVSFNWVTSSLDEKALLDVEPYIVCDTWGAKAVHRSLNSSGNYLLKTFAIAVVEPTLELTVPQIDELLDACGAIVLKDPRCFNFVPDKLLRVILTDKENVGEEATGWLKKYKAVVLRVDWLISTISQYEVISLNGYLQIPMTSEVLLGLGFPQELTEEDDDDIAD